MTIGGGGRYLYGKKRERAFCGVYDGFCESKPVVSWRAGHRFSMVAEIVLLYCTTTCRDQRRQIESAQKLGV